MNGKAPISMPVTATASTHALLKCPSEALRVENPAVETVVMAWLMASNPLIPASQ